MKIPTIPPQIPASDAVEKAESAAESASRVAEAGTVQGAAAAAADPVAQIAADVAAGKIGQKEAVDRILEDALGGPMMDAVPASVRADLENALRVLIEEDPHLKSLCAAIGPSEIK
jgi:hypothetical protein